MYCEQKIICKVTQNSHVDKQKHEKSHPSVAKIINVFFHEMHHKSMTICNVDVNHEYEITKKPSFSEPNNIYLLSYSLIEKILLFEI